MIRLKLYKVYIIILFSFFIFHDALSTSWPISHSETPDILISPFGSRSLSSVYDFHRGLDIRAADNTRVTSIRVATSVLFRGNANDRAGNKIRLLHENVMIQYCHLTSYVTNYDTFNEGETVGYSGTTAEPGSVDPHLHIDWVNSNTSTDFTSDNKVNPMGFLPYTNNGPPGTVSSSETAEYEFYKSDGDTNIFGGFSPHIHVTIKTEGTELDFNTVMITLTGKTPDNDSYDQTKLLEGGNIVNFNDRINCGSDNQITNNIYIGVHNFNPNVANAFQLLEFAFKINKENWNKCMDDYTEGRPEINGSLYVFDTADSTDIFYANLELTNDYKKKYQKFWLASNYPNPFNPKTKIEYNLDYESHIRLVVFNLLGQSINTLVNEKQRYGQHYIIWNGCDKFGNDVSSGTYIYQLEIISETGNIDFVDRKKMSLIR